MILLEKNKTHPGWRGSVGWALSHKAKGRWFHSQSGHRPGLQAQGLAGASARGNRSMFLSLSFPIPSPLSKISK